MKNTEISFLNRLSYRQARNAFFIALLLGFVISIVQISMDLMNERERLDSTVSQVIGTLKDVAVQAVYRIDNKQAEEVVNGLFNYRPIIKAELINDYGTTLAYRQRLPVESRLNWIAGVIIPGDRFTTTLKIIGTEKPGYIHVTVDRVLIVKDFIQRSVLNIISEFISIFVLALFLMLMFYFSLTLPILKTVKGLMSVDLDNPSDRQLPQYKGHQNDEFGMLTRTINDLLIKFTRSIDEHREAENKIKSSLNEKEVLLGEIHHRVKNNMQVISSLLSLQSDQIKDSHYAEKFNDSRHRIKSMALVHEKLYRSDDMASIDFRDYVTTLAQRLFLFYEKNSDKISLHIQIEDVSLGIDTAIPCGLIINELLTNALKHAFPDNRKGEITVIFNKNSSNIEKGYDLVVRDDGVGLPEGLNVRETESLGLQLIITLIEHQLQGTLEVDSRDGTAFHMSFREVEYQKRI